jgi:hypothetical protein
MKRVFLKFGPKFDIDFLTTVAHHPTSNELEKADLAAM